MKYKILYYSGTGCTKYAAETLENILKDEYGVSVITERIFAGKLYSDEEFDRLILMYPIYGANAPRSVIEHIDRISSGINKNASIICTSAGGDMITNLGAVSEADRILHKKGFKVTYQSHLITPSNIIYNQREVLAVELLKVLPLKLKKIAEDLTSDVEFRYQVNPISKSLSLVGKVEQANTFRFGKMMMVSDTCISCGKCARQCPEGNIEMVDGRPVFKDKCTMCTACVYGCPVKALKSLFMWQLINQNRFNLDNLLELAKTSKPLHESRIFALTSGEFKNARDYILSEKNKY